MCPLTARHRSWADSMSLKAIARPAARGAGSLGDLVRSRTVENVDSIGFEGFSCIQCSAGEVVERQQSLKVAGDLVGGLRPLRTELGVEAGQRGDGVIAVTAARRRVVLVARDARRLPCARPLSEPTGRSGRTAVGSQSDRGTASTLELLHSRRTG